MSFEQFWRLDSPSMCRDFLKSLRLRETGSPITGLTQADGKVISIDEASDDQIIQVANEIAKGLKGK